MTEFENQEPEQEFVQEEEIVEQHQEEVVEQPQETDKEINFRMLREERDRERAEKEEYRKRMMEMQDRMMSSQNQAPAQAPIPEERDEFADLDPSDWVTVEQSRRMNQKDNDKDFDRRWKAAKEKEAQENAKKHADSAPDRIKARFPDFDTVVSEQAVNQLKIDEPDIFNALGHIKDKEAQAVAAYKYIQKLNPEAHSQNLSKQRIEANANKPKTLAASRTGSPLSQAGAFEQGLTPSLMKQLNAEMNEAARRG